LFFGLSSALLFPNKMVVAKMLLFFNKKCLFCDLAQVLKRL
jgi:hypothetical protein